MRRVLVTGIGVISPLGVGTDVTWRRLLAGESAITTMPRLREAGLKCHLGAEVVGFEAGDFVSNRRNLRLMSDGDRLAFAAAKLAIQDAGLQLPAADPERVAIYVGGDKEVCDAEFVEAPFLAARQADGRVDEARWIDAALNEMYPLFYITALPGAVLFYISEAYGITGPSAYFAGTTDAGTTAVGTGFRAVRRGECDAAITGGFNDAIHWWTVGKVDSLDLLTGQNDLGPRAFRPYDRGRDGAVLGEGATFLVLEEADSARRRGARAYAEVVGFGAGLDAFGILTPEPTGEVLAQAIRRALDEGGLAPDDVGAVVSHGSASPLGDASEAAALRKVFGEQPRATGTAIKQATGHMIAASGSLNCAVAALALREGALPPTLHLEDLDPECRFSWQVGSSGALNGEAAVAIARGIDGQEVALTLRATD